MTLLRHVESCNVYQSDRFVPLTHQGVRLGLVRRDNAVILRRFPAVFAVSADAVRIDAAGGFDAVSAAVDAVVEALVTDGIIPKWRNEFFAVAPRWGTPAHFKLDRGAVPFFGTRAYGVHLNGFRHDAGKLRLWIGRRAPDKKVAPDKLDNLVAGGIGEGHGLFETLVKEAAEEAAIPYALIQHALPAGAISYRMETPLGVRDDVLFVYDLETPADFVPRNTDGEISAFHLMDATEAIERVRGSDDFKFNVNLVIIDFALRCGLLSVDEPDYLDLAIGLHRPLDQP